MSRWICVSVCKYLSVHVRVSGYQVECICVWIYMCLNVCVQVCDYISCVFVLEKGRL